MVGKFVFSAYKQAQKGLQMHLYTCEKVEKTFWCWDLGI